MLAWFDIMMWYKRARTLCLTFSFLYLRLQNKTLESCLTHLNPPLSEAHVTENQSSTLYSTKSSRPAVAQTQYSHMIVAPSSAGDMLPQASGHGGHSEGDHMLHSRVIWDLQILAQHQASLPHRCQPGRRARLYSDSSVRDEQLWSSLSRICHIKHSYSVSSTPNFYSVLKTCNCDVCEKPGVWLVSESWRTDGVSQRGFLLERIRLISLSHWFTQDACYQCLNSVLKAEVDFLIFKKAPN